jgi:SAM-dependent methyltransferase
LGLHEPGFDGRFGQPTLGLFLMANTAPHAAHSAPSAWLLRWAHLLRPHATVLDLACGSGRHVRWLAARGHAVTAVDRDAAALGPLNDCAQTLVADLEAGPWPLAERQFDAVLVTHYLWRPLLAQIKQAVRPGGVLIYETFAQGNERFGKPSNPQFLLQPGELLQAFAGLRVVAYEDGIETAAPATGTPLASGAAPARCVQRIVALAAEQAPGPALEQASPAAKLPGLVPLLHA